MAREYRTADQIAGIADELEKVVIELRSAVATMREAGMPRVLVHGAAQLNTYFPFVLGWGPKVAADAKAQAAAFKLGMESSAARSKRRNEQAKAPKRAGR